MYKGWSTTNVDSMFKLNTSVLTGGNSAKILKSCCRLDQRHHFFPEQVVNWGNSLDQHSAY